MIKVPKKPKTILTQRGYAIVKKNFDYKDIANCKKDLMVKPFVNNNYGAKVDSYPIFLESSKKLYLPKHYGFKHFGEPQCVKLTKGSEIALEFKGTLRPKQIPVVKAFLYTCKKGPFIDKSNGGIISVPCGWGKTIMALNIIAELSRKTIIIVHKEFLLNQWRERINEFLPDARVGIIQGPKIDIENKDIVLAMLQSISIKDYDPEIFKNFGFTIVDECHHISAEVFSRSLPKINSYYSLGLSATPKRADGLGKVFYMFLGPCVYKIDRDDKCVDVRVIMYNDPNNIKYNHEEINYMGKICMPRMINNVVNNNTRNSLILYLAKDLVRNGNQVIILSDRRNQLKYLYEQLSGIHDLTVGYYVGSMKQKDLKQSEKANIILGTFPMAAEGLDIPTLDAAIFASPKSNIQQSIGRITRKVRKTLPIAYDIVDSFSVFPNQYKKRLRLYKKLNYNISTTSITIKTTITDALIDYSLHNLQKLEKKTRKKQSKCLIEE